MSFKKGLLLLFACWNISLAAQFDIKFDPLSTAFAKNLKGGFEVAFNEHLSIDVDGLYSGKINIPIINLPSIPGRSYGARIITKYYLTPKYNIDGVYFGSYLKYRKNFGAGYIHKRGSIGIIGGLKLFTIENSYMEIGFGMGTRIYSSFQNPVGEFIDDLLGEPIVENIFDYFSRGVGRLDFTSRLLIGYRIYGNGPRDHKTQEKEIRP